MKKLVLLLTVVLVAFSLPAMAKHLEWTAPTTFTDNTAIPSGTLAKMKYYIRTKAPNEKSSTPDVTGWYYLGETLENGSLFWPSTNDIEVAIPQGQTREWSITAAYKDANGAWHESPRSNSVSLYVPFPEGKTPAGPGLRLVD